MATATFTSADKTATSTWIKRNYISDGKYVAECNEKTTGSSGNITFSTSSIPSGAYVTSAIVSFTVYTSRYPTASAYDVRTPLYFSSSTITFNGVQLVNDDVTYSGTQDVTSLLTTYNGGTFQDISITGITCRAYTRDYTQTSSYNTLYGANDWYTYGLNAIGTSLTLTVTYTVPGDAVYYGVNGSWQKCEMYYGTNGSWQKVYPWFGSGGGWK